LQPTQQHKAKKLSLRLLIVTLLLLLALFIFWRIADEIVVEKENNFDTFIFQKLAFLKSPFTTRLMVFLTFFGSNSFLFPAYTLLTAYFLFFRKNITIAINIAAVGISSSIVVNLVKDIFRRTRPLDPLIPNVNGFSFPSGHSFASFTFAGILIYLFWQSKIKKGWKYLLSILLILFASCIAFTRVYLHVHYPSDVIGGFCLSMLWLSFSLWLLKKITAAFNL
jgi:undecaprenyl-diphosphatase